MGKELRTTIINNIQVAKGIFEISLQTEAGLNVTPGQFANIGVPNEALLLKRPISINAYDEINGVMSFVYKVVGKGTTALSQMKGGGQVEIVAPLGKGFVLPNDGRTVFLVGGGIGCAPLEYVMSDCPDNKYYSFLGFDSNTSIYHENVFSDLSEFIAYATLDGSYGEKGFVTEPLIKALKKIKPDMLLACGPTPMLKAVKDVISNDDFPAFVSVEERMGCGMGGCAVCACKTKDGYKKACVDGPVFRLSEVLF